MHCIIMTSFVFVIVMSYTSGCGSVCTRNVVNQLSLCFCPACIMSCWRHTSCDRAGCEGVWPPGEGVGGHQDNKEQEGLLPAGIDWEAVAWTAQFKGWWKQVLHRYVSMFTVYRRISILCIILLYVNNIIEKSQKQACALHYASRSPAGCAPCMAVTGIDGLTMNLLHYSQHQPSLPTP